MAERDRLVRNRDDDAVEIRQLLRQPEEILDVGRLYLQRDHDRVRAARREALRDAGRRFHLRDRIADGDVDAGGAVEGSEHEWAQYSDLYFVKLSFKSFMISSGL